MSKTSLPEFYDLLEAHDWYYDWSDDFGVWSRGNLNMKKLTEIGKESEEHQKLLDEFYAYRFSGESFGTPKAKKPAKPST